MTNAEVGMRKWKRKKLRRWEGEKDKGALRLRSAALEERPGGLEKECGRGKWEVGVGDSGILYL
jgi:hypothetical protein